MSLRKLAGLAAGFALAVGLIGTGVSAQWSKSVTAQENINVGSFGCAIVDWTGAVSPTPQQSVSFTALPIVNSIPGQAAFSFTVKNTGTVPQNLTISSSGISSPFVDLLGTPAAVPLNGSDTHTYNGGVSWPDLTNYTGGLSASITYTVNCTEKPAIAVVVTGPVTGSGPLGGQNVLQLTVQGVGFADNSPILLAYDATPGISGDTASDPEKLFGQPVGPNTSSFNNVWFQENCSTGNAGPSIGVDVPFTITAHQGANTASFTGTLPCSQVHNP